MELGKNPLVTIVIGYEAYGILKTYNLYPTIEAGVHFKL